jgi:Carboxypeptidase regulatory-like domain
MPTGSKKMANRGIALRMAAVAMPMVLVLALSLLSGGLKANTCVPVPPVKIVGAFCGGVIDATGEEIPDIELNVVDDKGAVTGWARTNAKGDFKFPALPKGLYVLTTTAPGWRNNIGQIEILDSNQTRCRRPTTVMLGVVSCEGGISKHKPRHFHEPGW